MSYCHYTRTIFLSFNIDDLSYCISLFSFTMICTSANISIYIYIYMYICICVYIYIICRRSITPKHTNHNSKSLDVAQSLYFVSKLPTYRDCTAFNDFELYIYFINSINKQHSNIIFTSNISTKSVNFHDVTSDLYGGHISTKTYTHAFLS